MSDHVYCYPGSNVLINKRNIRTGGQLKEAETLYVSARLAGLQAEPVKGGFDFGHLCRIHGYLFQDLYEWAGVPRTVAIAKGSLFCLPQHISSYAGSIFPKLYRECLGAKDSPERFARTLAGHYADLNALHPFREGNGRAQREFTRALCLACGYRLDLTLTDRDEMLHASIRSLDAGDNAPLEAIFRKAAARMQGSILS